MNAPVPKLPINESTKAAQETTFLSPRFYTTDFVELDRTNVEPVRRDWDVLIAELKADPNKRHFTRNEEFDCDLSAMEPELRKEFLDFLVSSITPSSRAACSTRRCASARRTRTSRSCSA